MTEADLDELLRALAHTERRRILAACRDEERAAGDLAAGSDLALASVSEHLKVLRKTGLVVLHRDGRRWLYRADLERLAAALDVLTALRGTGEAR